MSLESNYGTQYYGISCGVPSDVSVDVNSNIFTGYYSKEPNDYILWGQLSSYSHPTTNVGSNYYFLECDVPSESGLDLVSNKGTHYYYSSAFNCVTFCDPIYYNLEDITYSLQFNGDYLYYNGDLLTWTLIL
jgi:hypothetical protein